MNRKVLLPLSFSVMILAATVLPSVSQQSVTRIATIFNPILSSLKSRLQANQVTRLPESLYLFEGRNLSPNVLLIENSLIVDFDSEPNCQYGYCKYEGRIGTYFSRLPLDDAVFYLYSDSDTYKAPITLIDGIRGMYIHNQSTRIRYGPTIQIAWHQDQQTYHILFPVSSQHPINLQKEALIKMAMSMANSSPIRP